MMAIKQATKELEKLEAELVELGQLVDDRQAVVSRAGDALNLARAESVRAGSNGLDIAESAYQDAQAALQNAIAARAQCEAEVQEASAGIAVAIDADRVARLKAIEKEARKIARTLDKPLAVTVQGQIDLLALWKEAHEIQLARADALGDGVARTVLEGAIFGKTKASIFRHPARAIQYRVKMLQTGRDYTYRESGVSFAPKTIAESLFDDFVPVEITPGRGGGEW